MLTGLTGFLPESTLTLYDNLEFLFRILLSAALGAAIGLERTKRQKEAGVRTHCIIACASAVFMILSKYAFIDTAALDGSRGADTARIAAQVVSGISFLGAGVIFKNHPGPDHCRRYVGHRRRGHGHRRGYVLAGPDGGCGAGGDPAGAAPVPGGRRC